MAGTLPQTSEALRLEPYADLTVVIPTLNEESSIGILLESLSSLYPGVSVIVCDDGSVDKTVEIVSSKSALFSGELLFLDRRDAAVHGLTASVCDGLLKATTEYAVVMDGDLQHPISVVSSLLEGLRKGRFLSVGVRERRNLNQGPHRVLVTLIFTLVANLVLRFRGYRIRDPLSGLFGVSTSFFNKIYSSSPEKFVGEGYKILFDLLRAAPAGQKIDEVVYRFEIRRGGGSKAGARHALCFLRSLFR